MAIIHDAGVPPNMYDTILDWAKKHHDQDFSFSTCRHHTVVMKRMIAHYAPGALRHPSNVTVESENVPAVQMPTFQVLPQISRLLNNTKLTEGALLRYNSTKSPEDGSHLFGDLNTCDLWKAEEEKLLALAGSSGCFRNFRNFW